VATNAIDGAVARCSFGSEQATLKVVPTSRVTIEGRSAAVITDTEASVNVPPFGTCSSMANPVVAAASAEADGTLTPMPCEPAIIGTWIPVAPRTVIGGQPALTAGSICACAYGGVISLVVAGAVRTTST
jgi:hypothetical protein